MTRRVSQAQQSYRDSHSSEGYGVRYRDMYSRGYYKYQWQQLERPLLRDLVRRYLKTDAQRILDFACGTGRILGELERLGDDVTGIDVSSTMLGEALLRCPHSRIIKRDITSSPLEERFDVITAFRFFLNAEPQLRNDSLQALHHMLDDNGVLIANIHQNSHSPLGYAHRIRNRLRGRDLSHDLSYKDFVALLDRNGFETVEALWYSYLPRPGWFASDFFGRMLLPFEHLCRTLGIPEGICQCFVVVARKKL